MNLRIRVSLALIPCREIENLKKLLYLIKKSYKIYIEDKEGKWVNMGNNSIAQILIT